MQAVDVDHGDLVGVEVEAVAGGVGHVGPEAAVGGPIGLLKNGDIIELAGIKMEFTLVK